MAHGGRELGGHLSRFGRFLARRERREREDTTALSELAARPLALPEGVELSWLGVAGYRLGYAGHAVYMDPYVTRVPFRAMLSRRPSLPDVSAHERLLGAESARVEAILVGHTHFDHAVDVPALARRWDTRVYGSSSLRGLMALHGEGERAVEVTPQTQYELGPFRVTFFPSLHSKLLLGYKVPADGEFSCEHLDALSANAYRCGDIYGIRIEVAGASFYHQGSANLIDELVPRGGVDFFLAGIAGRSFTRDYWARMLPLLEPKTVVASHFDDFFRAIDGPLGFSLNVNLTALPEEVHTVSHDFDVRALTPRLPGAAGSASAG